MINTYFVTVVRCEYVEIDRLKIDDRNCNSFISPLNPLLWHVKQIG